MVRDGGRSVQPEVDACLATGGHVHLVGICGIGMAGLAVLLRQRGCQVTGCDAAADTRVGHWLCERGIKVQAGHSADHIIEGVKWVVRTAAVGLDHDEIAAALRRDVPVFCRGEVLPRLLKGTTSVAVSGTHGKTTTSTFIAQLLTACGVKTSWCIGGEIESLGGVAGVGESDVLVVEADESDGTVALYEPDVAVVTNVEFDHMEHFDSVEDFESCFRRFISQAGRAVIHGADDARASTLCTGRSGALSYGTTDGATFRIKDVHCGVDTAHFKVDGNGQSLGTFRLPLTGHHNVLNAVAAMLVARELGVPWDTLHDGLASLSLPRRRFEVMARHDDVMVVSDYAHHPSEIAALIRMARLHSKRRLRVVYQPHRFSRTRALGPDFPAAFAGVDELILVPVYPASEAPLEGGTAADLYTHFRAADPGDVSSPVWLAESVEDAWEYYRRTLAPGDMLLVAGAGDVEWLARAARDALNARLLVFQLGNDTGGPGALPVAELTDSVVRFNFPMRGITSFGLGGAADCLVEVGNRHDLGILRRWTTDRGLPLRLLGGGFNVLAGDLGVSGVVVRLCGDEFFGIEADGETVQVGGAVPLARLLDWAEARGLTGLENLEGIPGTVGGACRMNAGAHGTEIGDHLLWIRCLKSDGSEDIVSRETMGLEYRTCRALRNALCVGVALRLKAGDRVAIHARRLQVAARRAWMNGTRSAGSVFKNPPDDFAGRLLEAAGFKGVQLGGAGTSPAQANFLTVGVGAVASDVRALVQRMQTSVAMRYGVTLETEIRFWGLIG